MAFCDEKDWEMTLNIDGSGDSETLIFRLVAGGTGRVDVPPNNKLSNLKWTCLTVGTFGQPNAKALMSFIFRFRRAGKEFGVLMSGFAHLNNVGNTVFRGRFRTFNLDAKVPAAGAANLQTLTFSDPGDTGTGTGNQT